MHRIVLVPKTRKRRRKSRQPTSPSQNQFFYVARLAFSFQFSAFSSRQLFPNILYQGRGLFPAPPPFPPLCSSLYVFVYTACSTKVYHTAEYISSANFALRCYPPIKYKTTQKTHTRSPPIGNNQDIIVRQKPFQKNHSSRIASVINSLLGTIAIDSRYCLLRA